MHHRRFQGAACQPSDALLSLTTSPRVKTVCARISRIPKLLEERILINCYASVADAIAEGE